MGMKEFGELIQKARVSADKRGADVARKAGISATMLSDFELGKKANPPTPDVLASLAEQLGIPQYRMLIEVGYEVGAPKKNGDTEDPEIEELVTLLRRAQLDFKDRFHLRHLLVDIGKVNRGEAPG